jgi:hypothetical protein
MNSKLKTPNSKLDTDRSGHLIPWQLLYTVVLGELALLIALFYFFTKAFE